MSKHPRHFLRGNCAMDGIRVPAVIKQAPWEPCAPRGSKPSDSSVTRGGRNAVPSPTLHSTPIPLPLSVSLSLAQSPLEEATLISQALMRQNGTDLVCRCATGGAGQGGWRSMGGMGEEGGEVGVCHLSPCTRLARQSPEWRRRGSGDGARALLV